MPQCAHYCLWYNQDLHRKICQSHLVRRLVSSQLTVTFIMLIVAFGAITAILFVSSSLRNLFSTFMMSFFLNFPLGTFNAIVIRLPSEPSILSTKYLKTLPSSIWSITVPSLIRRTKSSDYFHQNTLYSHLYILLKDERVLSKRHYLN